MDSNRATSPSQGVRCTIFRAGRKSAPAATNTPRGRSPDAHAIAGRQVQALPRLHVKGGVPRVEIADRVGAVLVEGMAVGQHLLPGDLLAVLRLPALRITEEERPVVRSPARPICVV